IVRLARSRSERRDDVAPERAPVAGRVPGQACLQGRTIHIADVSGPQGDPFPLAQESARRRGFRAVVAVPLLRAGVASGALTATRTEPFQPEEIALLETFADQAVIAIENARLFSELAEKSQQLEEAS